MPHLTFEKFVSYSNRQHTKNNIYLKDFTDKKYTPEDLENKEFIEKEVKDFEDLLI